MKEIPYKLNIQAMIAKIVQNECAGFWLVKNLFDFQKNGMICVSDIIEIAKKIKFSTPVMEKIILNIKEEKEVFTLGEYFQKLYHFGFIENISEISKLLNKKLEIIYNDKFKD